MSKTAMQIMYEELMCYEYTIPLELIVKCKELIDVEKEQIIKAVDSNFNYDNNGYPTLGEQYYNETYKK